MKDKVFVDINVAIDLLAERIPYYEVALELFSYAESGLINVSFSSLGFSTIDYLLSKRIGKIKSKLVLKKFKRIVTVLAVDEQIIENALNSDFSDFEDGIQYEVAKKNLQEVIVTRNISDYKKSDIPVLLPQDFLKIALQK